MKKTLTAIAILITLAALPAFAGGYEDGKAALTRGEVQKGVDLITASAKEGDARSQLILGELYASGRGVPHNFTTACDWWEKASDQLPEALHQLAVCYTMGNGRPLNVAKGMVMFKSAAAKGHSQSLCAMGRLYVTGAPGFKPNPEKGVSLAREGAMKGDPVCQARYADFIIQGLGGLNKDMKEAAKWMGKSANQGYPEAMFNYALMYRDGNGIAQDRDKAATWLQRAATRGYSPASFRLGELLYASSVNPEAKLVKKELAGQAYYWLLMTEITAAPQFAELAKPMISFLDEALPADMRKDIKAKVKKDLTPKTK